MTQPESPIKGDLLIRDDRKLFVFSRWKRREAGLLWVHAAGGERLYHAIRFPGVKW